MTLFHRHKWKVFAVWHKEPKYNDFGGAEWDGAYVDVCTDCFLPRPGIRDYLNSYEGAPAHLFASPMRGDSDAWEWEPLCSLMQRGKRAGKGLAVAG